MNVKRLTILRDALIEHAMNPGNLKFDLGGWAIIDGKHFDPDAAIAVNGARLGENFCGTTACACGLAASIPAFKEDALGLQFDHWRSGGKWGAILAYKGETGFGAAVDFFDLSWDDAIELFSPNAYIPRDHKDPLAVADKITALLHTA